MFIPVEFSHQILHAQFCFLLKKKKKKTKKKKKKKKKKKWIITLYNKFITGGLHLKRKPSILNFKK